MKKLLSISIFLLLTASVAAQKTLDDWAKNLLIFGRTVPQEEVFVHMDNSSYYVGDTLYFKAYTRLSTGEPSKLSGLLYVELLNNDGYLVERQKIKMENGQGRGAFLLEDSLYGGYYELRAYTRWQLNWGQFEHEHSDKVKNWFYSKDMMHEFFRDYDKLYSRVFPVYDKPREAGDYNQNMTLRPMRRYVKVKSEKPEAVVTFYPEGGNMVEGAPCRLAFEANNKDGRHLKGTLTVKDNAGNTVATAKTESRGRSSVTIPQVNSKQYKAEFQWGENYSSTAILPQSEKEGIALQADQQGETLHLTLHNMGAPATEQLAYTVMSHGVVKLFNKLEAQDKHEIDIDLTKLPTGVAQLTVFNAQGRVYADRLVFVRHQDFKGQNISFQGLSEKAFKPYEPITIGVQGTGNATVSLTVRDAAHSEYTFDSGNIMTEMLLASQIKGFVEQPEYYFESNDEEHQRALDLLLMIQGWRRYNWVEMATPGIFHANEPYETTEWIFGEVHKYEAEEQSNFYTDQGQLAMDMDGASADYNEFENEFPEFANREFIKKWGGLTAAKRAAAVLKYDLNVKEYDSIGRDPMDVYVERTVLVRQAQETDRKKIKVRDESEGYADGTPHGTLKKEVTVHAEFMLGTKVKKDVTSAATGEMETYNGGLFRLQAPAFDTYCYFFCTASDHTKWKDGKEPIWVAPAEIREDMYGNGEINYPEFYVRFKNPYPRFVKPYNFYQDCVNESPRKTNKKLLKVDDATILDEFVVGAKRTGLRSFDASKPAIVLEPYDAFNDVVDAGMNTGYYLGADRFISDVARTYVGDMNMERNYELIPRFNSKDMSYSHLPGALERYNHLHNLDKVYIYTDYSPRREGDKRYSQSNQPQVEVDLRVKEDKTRYVTYRDRRKLMWGFSVCTDFYNPDYSNVATPNPKDYRRTLYWNPDLQLDENGRAEVKFYNNNSQTNVTVSAEGMDANGGLMTGISYPEDR